MLKEILNFVTLVSVQKTLNRDKPFVELLIIYLQKSLITKIKI